MKTLSLCHFPLDSLSLIEASAGTGKTYAVSNLYIRYLIEKKLDVEQILVVTFTEAATQELRDRIRARIQELSSVFSGSKTDDEVLNFIYENSTDREADKLRLRIAERQMDQAEIHTIHGFCQQLLARYALDLNITLKQKLIEDPKPLLLRVCEDFWRKKVLKLPQDLMLEVYSYWSSPEELMAALEPMINRRPEVCNPELLEGGLEAWVKHYDAVCSWYSELRKKTIKDIDEVYEAVENSNLKAVKKKLEWLGLIRDWCEAEGQIFDLPKTSSKKDLFQVFMPETLKTEAKKNALPPEHAYFKFLEQHFEKAPDSSRDVLLVQVYQEIIADFQVEKDAQGGLTFDDLILSVSKALQEASTFSLLSNAVRERFSVALIDEFQDTDKEQYHIFSSIFASSLEGKVDASLVLIGDPKQAIYAFRGGDIATYLRAKQDIMNHKRGHLFTMDTNWRSSEEMVNSVNRIFLQGENPFISNMIPFLPVKAVKSPPEYLANKPAFNISCLKGEGRKKEELELILANHTVQQILELLDTGNVEFSDIAVLVRSAREAELIRQRLVTHGLGASYEGKSNIYDSEESLAIYRLLAAVAEPSNEYLIIHCLSDLFFGFDDAKLFEIKHNDEVFEQYVRVFNDLHVCWLKFGVLSVIRKALIDLGVYSRWNENNGAKVDKAWERRLTNVNQLAELLQHQSQRIRGHFALIRWLYQNISESTQTDDTSRLRLESDEQLIRIVTIHKSKGLEYPYVFIPFVSGARGSDLAWFYDDSGRLNLDLLGLESNTSLVERERLAEDIRLLYVALTRAKYQCFLSTFFYKGRGASLGTANTAWAYLVGRDEVIDGLDEDSYISALERLANNSGGSITFNKVDENFPLLQHASLKIRCSDEEQVNHNNAEPEDENIQCSSAFLERSLNESWRVQSFTGLMQDDHASGYSSAKKSSKDTLVNEDRSELSIFDFPRGSKAGTFLHTLFENIEFSTAKPIKKFNEKGETIDLKLMIREQLLLARIVEEELIDVWADYLSRWLANILRAPLSQSFSLSCLANNEYQSEMEFFFKVDQCHQDSFNRLVAKFSNAPSLQFSSFEGYMQGAIDLVFVNEGKYYLLDYKSNFLGTDMADYAPENLHQAMLEHRYDIQYLIYTVALHRYLKARLGKRYSYADHFGGVYYLYLRGMSMAISEPDSQGNGIYTLKPQAELIESLDSHLRGGVR